MKIKSVYGNYRNIGKYWAYKPGELNLFKQTLMAWWHANDSVVTSGTLPEELLGKGLGQLKLECTAEKGVFLAPKVYALHNVMEDG